MPSGSFIRPPSLSLHPSCLEHEILHLHRLLSYHVASTIPIKSNAFVKVGVGPVDAGRLRMLRRFDVVQELRLGRNCVLRGFTDSINRVELGIIPYLQA